MTIRLFLGKDAFYDVHIADRINSARSMMTINFGWKPSLGYAIAEESSLPCDGCTASERLCRLHLRYRDSRMSI